MSSSNNTIKKKMIDAGIENFKELAKAIGMKYDTMLVRLKDPSGFRVYEITKLATALNLSGEEILLIFREA